MIKDFATYKQETGGRAILLFLLFGLAIYQFVTAGFSAFAIVCCSPILVVFAYFAFKYRMFTFWMLLIANSFVMFFSMQGWLPSGIPASMYNELLEIILLSIAIVDARRTPHFERTANIMLYALIMWCGFCILEILNDTCNLGINVKAWYQGSRKIAFQIMYAFLVFTVYIDNAKVLKNYLYLWTALAIFSCFWVWKQKTFGLLLLKMHGFMDQDQGHIYFKAEHSFVISPIIRMLQVSVQEWLQLQSPLLSLD